MDALLGWPVLLWALRVLGLIVTVGAIWVSLLTLRRLLGAGARKAILDGELPGVKEFGLFGGKVVLRDIQQVGEEVATAKKERDTLRDMLKVLHERVGRTESAHQSLAQDVDSELKRLRPGNEGDE